MDVSRPPERRLRVRRKPEIEPGKARMNPQMMQELQITDEIEVVISGKRKCILTVRADEKVPLREVWASAEEMRELGIADNSIATIRRPLR
ncbi:MAG: hypothetical protein DRJ26_02005 [Candidatus Methanomethylicota archaeon]|uniref:Uncharacterized protein n=1 Tax=Thermoproteota archaeon TaxID=2056631 RepID=A0A497F403_9CREN|nr:MAG: hypothetical protein DRJ26_02005 [Candidatus Verstraetearchaeota archaeon]